MTNLRVRRIPFEFDETTPFQWNPANPRFGILGNLVSFMAPGFEKYIVAVCRDALHVIKDPEVAAECDAFLRQEADHARAHRHHTNALIARYPGLRQAVDLVTESYDELYARESFAFGLAYIADIEATFTPLFGTWLEHGDQLFDNGEARVASLLVWHFVEEVEHRASAFTIYNEVIPSRVYRLRALPGVRRHVQGLAGQIAEVFDEAVPLEDRLVDASAVVGRGHSSRADRSRDPFPGPFHHVPAPALRSMAHRLLWSQLPFADPAREREPAVAHRWHADHDRGLDMRRWTGRPADQTSADPPGS